MNWLPGSNRTLYQTQAILLSRRHSAPDRVYLPEWCSGEELHLLLSSSPSGTTSWQPCAYNALSIDVTFSHNSLYTTQMASPPSIAYRTPDKHGCVFCYSSPQRTSKPCQQQMVGDGGLEPLARPLALLGHLFYRQAARTSPVWNTLGINDFACHLRPLTGFSVNVISSC